ncbi:hypothetical protein J4216_04630 [Candidatus Woesearchaeota archaeon]|nr:hypothetical protein [Candidatus Woesearchaeota archaeon]
MSVLSRIRFDQSMSLEGIFSKLEAHYRPSIELELNQAQEHLRKANEVDSSRIKDLREIIQEALKNSASRLKARADKIAKLSDVDSYFTSVELVRWYEEDYLTNLDDKDPELVRLTHQKLHDEHKQKLDSLEDDSLRKTEEINLVIHEKAGHLCVGLPIYTTHNLDGENNLTNRVYNLIKDRLKQVGKLKEESEDDIVYLVLEEKPAVVYSTLEEISKSRELRRLNLDLRVYDSTSYLERKAQLLSEEIGLPEINPKTIMTVKEVAGILGISPKTMYSHHYKGQLCVSPDSIDPKVLDLSERELKNARLLVTGERLYRFANAYAESFKPRCKFIGFSDIRQGEIIQ